MAVEKFHSPFLSRGHLLLTRVVSAVLFAEQTHMYLPGEEVGE